MDALCSFKSSQKKATRTNLHSHQFSFLLLLIDRYFIPEDGDVETQPNVFLAPKPRQQGYPPSLGQVKQAFPLPGRYHFRFKSPLLPGSDRDKGALAVWMDCVDDRQPVLTWRSQIIAKVTRVGIEEDDDDDEDFQRPSPAASNASSVRAEPTPPAQQPAAASFDLFDHGPPASAPSPAVAPQPNLLDTHTTTTTSSSSSGGAGASLLDMNYSQPHHHPHTSSSHHQASAHSDFLGMTSTTSPPVSGNNVYQQPMQPPPPQQQQPQRSFDSFGNNSGGAFGGLGTPWK